MFHHRRPSLARWLVLLAVLCASSAAAQDAVHTSPCGPTSPGAVPPPLDEPCLRVSLPLADLPYNAEGGVRLPSMAQSLAASGLFFEGAHRLIEDAWGRRRWMARLSIGLFDLADSLLLPLPGGPAWLHEEYHRAVMGRRGIDSFNDVYKFRFAPDIVAVSRVRDEDLVALKADHPAEQVRLSMAGLEAEQHLVETLQQNQFFGRSRAWHLPLYWIEKLSTFGYLYSGSLADVDADTDEMHAHEGGDIRRRDFTGHDFTAWVYDLHRPDEPYTARGIHPSGVGIDRYIRHADLTPQEVAYVRKQAYLHLLNFVDPFLLGYTRFTVHRPVNGPPLEMNLRLGHVLTPFGRTVETNVFASRGRLNLFVTAHAYANGERTLPGIDARVVEYPVRVLGRDLLVSPRVALWRQPQRLRFDDRAAATGGLASVRVTRHVRGRVGPFVEFEAKSAGWVKGNEYLGRNVAVRSGVALLLR